MFTISDLLPDDAYHIYSPFRSVTLLPLKVQCESCHVWKRKAKMYGHKKCYQCRINADEENIPPEEPVKPLFERGDSITLTPQQKWGIVTLHLEGQDAKVIAQKISCHTSAVYRYVNMYQTLGSISNPKRGSRKRKTDGETDGKIIEQAEAEPFTTTSEIKRELQLPVSSRTVRRRLDEKGLHGRVAQH